MVDKNQRKMSESMLLVDVAKRLRNERVDQVIESFREKRVSTIRVLIVALFFLWTWFWVTGPQEVLVHDAVKSFPWISAFLGISIVWMIVLRLGYFKDSTFADIFGVIFNFVIVGILMRTGFLLLITLGALLPFMSIAVGARYSRRAFVASIVASVFILWVSAPNGYWLGRPAYALYALSLAIGLPIMIGRLLNALRDVSVQAVEARDAQNRFISTMSHELRTPLNAIIGGGQLIDVDQLVGDQKSLMKAIISNADALLRRVNEVLDVAAINGGRIALVEEPMFFSDVLQTVRDSCELQAKEKGVSLSVQPCEGYQGAVIGDLGRIEQVLINLTTNAVKFTPTGGSVSVKVTTEQSSSASTERITCSVTDTGIGISALDKSKIFDAFHQVSAGQARIHSGVGLGLYIVKSISDLMHGSLKVEDNPGGGTIFTWVVNLTRVAGSVEGTSARPTISALQALDNHRMLVRSMRCLVIEDNASNVEIIKILLTLAGHEMVSAMDGQTGLERIRKEQFDVVFLDLHMPGMTGWNVLEHLAIDPGMEKLPPVVILSADSDPHAAIKASHKGVLGYLTKPISTPKLLSVLEIASATTPLELMSANAPPETSNSDVGNLSLLDELRQLGSREAIPDFLQACLKTLNDSMNSLERDFASGELKDVGLQVHSVKNVFRNLGLQEGASTCDLLTDRVHQGGEFTAVWYLLKLHAARARETITNEPEFKSGVTQDASNSTGP